MNPESPLKAPLATRDDRGTLQACARPRIAARDASNRASRGDRLDERPASFGDSIARARRDAERQAGTRAHEHAGQVRENTANTRQNTIKTRENANRSRDHAADARDHAVDARERAVDARARAAGKGAPRESAGGQQAGARDATTSREAAQRGPVARRSGAGTEAHDEDPAIAADAAPPPEAACATVARAGAADRADAADVVAPADAAPIASGATAVPSASDLATVPIVPGVAATPLAGAVSTAPNAATAGGEATAPANSTRPISTLERVGQALSGESRAPAPSSQATHAPQEPGTGPSAALPSAGSPNPPTGDATALRDSAPALPLTDAGEPARAAPRPAPGLSAQAAADPTDALAPAPDLADGHATDGPTAPDLLTRDAATPTRSASADAFGRAGSSGGTAFAPPAPGSAPPQSIAAHPPTAHPSAAGSIATPLAHPAFANHFATEVASLALRGIERAEIVLNPSELGPVRIELSLSGEAARVAFSAVQPQTRHAIEQTLPILESMLAEHGLMLSGSSVSDGGAQRESGPGAERYAGATTDPREPLFEASLTRLAGAATPVRPASGLLDLYA